MNDIPDARGHAADVLARSHGVLDLLTTMVAVVAADATCLRVNSALENTVQLSRRALLGGNMIDWFADAAAPRDALRRVAGRLVHVNRFDALLRRHPIGTGDLPVHVTVSPIGNAGPVAQAMVEMIEIEQQVRRHREEHAHDLARSHQDLLRNLAHEIKNPLGGIRGAAQLLALEAASRGFADYTDVIVREVDRLQALVDQLLEPHRRESVLGEVNIHEVCEHVRALVRAEFPGGLEVRRDYDVSLPELRGDRERLIQAVLNIVRNAAQALAARIAAGDACIVLRTRVAQQVTIGRQCFPLAVELRIEDNGPGIPENLRERVFQPLLSGRPGGCGLGLTLAQTFVQQHRGTIEYDSTAEATWFRLLLPLP